MIVIICKLHAGPDRLPSSAFLAQQHQPLENLMLALLSLASSVPIVIIGMQLVLVSTEAIPTHLKKLVTTGTHYKPTMHIAMVM